MQYIIVKGNPVDGFSFLGPFEAREDAIEYGDSVDSEWWVACLDEPEGRRLPLEVSAVEN